MKKVIVPVAGAKNVTLFGEQYDVEDGGIVVSDEVAQQILTTPDLQESAGHGLRWKVEDIEEEEVEKNVGKGKAKK